MTVTYEIASIPAIKDLALEGAPTPSCHMAPLEARLETGEL